MTPDHYQALGVLPGASRDEIRFAYLRLMREHHPDRRPRDPVSAERARAANAAWRVLRDVEGRRTYDRQLAAPRAVAGPAGTRLAAAGRRPAYSHERALIRRRFHTACLRIGAAVFASGLALLLAAA